MPNKEEQLETILVVDDDDLMLRTVSRLLTRNGYKTDTANNGYKAIDMAKEKFYDFVISDIRMPGINGIDTLTKIKEISPETRGIIITGYASEETPVKAIKLGVDDYILKPFELEAFMHSVNKNVERRRLEKEVIKLNAEKLKAERLATVGQMASTIIHDIKNPMTIIKGFADIIARSDPKQKVYTDRIVDAVDKLVVMAHEVLDYSRGETKLRFKTTTIKAFIDELNAYIEVSFKDKQITYTHELQYDDIIEMDSDRMHRVFLNIANNARDAMEEGESFHLLAREDGEKKDYIIFELKDTGKGIPEEIRDTIFEAFVTHGKKKGTGLGMAIVKRIVEAHGGEITFESEIDKGTTFFIKLPKVIPQDVKEAIKAQR